MSQLIKPISVKDTVLDIGDSIDFAVFKSGMSISKQKFSANNPSSTQHVYNVIVPSVNTIVSRNVIWSSNIVFTLAGTVGQYEYLYNSPAINQSYTGGATPQGADCFSPFPLNSLCTTMTCQINNTTVVQNNMNVILDPILRGLDKEDIQKWYSSTPTQLDYWGNYADALPQLNAYAGAYGAAAAQNPYIATWNSPFNTGNRQNCKDLASRASFKFVSVVNNTVGAPGAGAQKNVTVTINVSEPLIMSPFLFSGDLDQTGLTGITQMNFTMSMDALARRALRWVLSPTAGSTKSVTSVTYTEANLEFCFYTPPPTFLVPATCATPLQQFVNYTVPNNNNVTIAPGGTSTLQSSSLQLNSIPDKAIITVDDAFKYGASGNLIPDHYGTITKVNILFNNQPGILSTFSQASLSQASQKSGSQQTWEEFSGLVNVAPGALGGSYGSTGTCGSVLYLNFSEIINIAEVYNAPGSLSVTQFQVEVTCVNNTGMTISPVLNVLFLYSGVLATTNGNSSSYLNGILTRNDVLNAANLPHMANRELVRYVGSGALSDLKAMAHNYLPAAKKLLDNMDNKYAKLGAQALDTFGLGNSGGVSSAGVSSAGVSSAGRLKKKLM